MKRITILVAFITAIGAGAACEGWVVYDDGHYGPPGGPLPGGPPPVVYDADGDGLSDDAELTQGLNPNDGRSFPTGNIASLPLRGEATTRTLKSVDRK
jgi:hypothetical protein